MIDFKKLGLTWSDAYLVRNELPHIIPAMDPELYPDRSEMRYYLDLKLPEFPLSPVFETMLTLEGREKPPTLSAGAQIYEGCEFRLEEILAGQLSITLPDRGANEMTAIASLTTPYVIRERIEPGLWDKSLTVRTAIRAGIAARDFAGYQHNFFSRYQSEKRQFLTWQPNEKMVSPKQPEYLYFLLNMAPFPGQIRLRIRITQANGVRETITHSTIEGLRPFQVICCPVSVQALGMGDDVTRYEIWLSDQENRRFTEVRAFNVDRRHHPFERFVLFSNSLGGFDTLRVLGKATQETDVTKATTRKERPTGKGLDFSELEIIGVTENSGIQFSTGFFEKDAATYADYLRELMVSEVVLMESEYGFEAMNLITDNLKYSEDRPGLIERTFQLKRTYSDKNYSRMPAAAPIAARASKWVGFSSRAVLDVKGKRTGNLTWERLQKVYSDDGSKVIPYAVKANIPGDPDYIKPWRDESISPGSTPYPSKAIARVIDFKRQGCGKGFLGTAPTVAIEAGKYGGEMPGDADTLAEAEFSTYNTQQYANSKGLCEVNNIPVYVAILHKIAMNDLKVIANGKYGPVVDLRIDGSVLVTNTTGQTTPTVRQSDTTIQTGVKNLVLEVEYKAPPFQACKLKAVGKNKELTVTGPGFYILDNVQINSSDQPLVIEVIPV
ncbi:DUF5977 domain-containing protein [Dyadobacter crusticola]|uniref:DUF5977 domain-containing protein n=1 Tax=Dyadobacter crusticola TaxID=292407 RepID=UPI0004E1AE04|nr:hypothetical protein [Dyadobacter crusticola]